jgi:hypothetical protein
MGPKDIGCQGVDSIYLGEISGSHDSEYEDNCFLGCFAV